MEFGWLYLALIKTIRAVKLFATARTQGAVGQDSRLTIRPRAPLLRRRKSVMGGPLYWRESARPSEDPLVTDADGEFLAIEVFEQWDRILT